MDISLISRLKQGLIAGDIELSKQHTVSYL